MRTLLHLILIGLLATFVHSTHARASVLHPEIQLLDAAARPVLESKAPVSPMQSCGVCHDTAFISSHSYHASLGAGDGQPVQSGREFDWAPGWIGRFDPLVYDRFDPSVSTAPGADPTAAMDLGLANWVMSRGQRHVGGGLSTHTMEGISLERLSATEVADAFTYIRSDGGSALEPWDWKKSGVTEMNCFLCHLSDPANSERDSELREGRFGWSATATLAHTGVVKKTVDGWSYVTDRFDENGRLRAESLGLGAPTNKNCGLCHGAVVTGPDEPFLVTPSISLPQTETTGEIIAGHRIRRSGMNVAGKDSLSRPWDVHAERMVQCTDCHGSLNDPAFATRPDSKQPEHLVRSAGGLSIGQFLQTPSHDFGKGHSSQATVARDLDGTVRECEDCHRSQAVHDWLPYSQRHLSALRCESCHVPKMYAAARQQTDWTVLDANRQPVVAYRGVAGDPSDPSVLLHGFEPLLLPREELDGRSRWSPQNLMASWYWFDRDRRRPVPRRVLESAIFGENGGYRPEIVNSFDTDRSGAIDRAELRCDSPAKTMALEQSLARQGVENVEIRGELQPYGIHHDVAAGRWATRECTACHGENSRFSQDFPVADYVPGGVTPQLVGDATVSLAGDLVVLEDGRLVYRSNPSMAGFYLLGFEKYSNVDVFGRWAVILVLLGALFHGGIRVFLWSIRDSSRTVDAQKRSMS